MTRLFNRLISMPTWAHIGATLAGFAGFNMAKAQLDASYAASNHPVDYATGQTTFDGDRIKGFYAHMSDLGTLDIYVQTQIIDFAFIAGVFLTGLMLGTLLMRFANGYRPARIAGIVTACAFMVGAGSDAVENLISFVMLANPTDFANWLALPYSGFAVLKFALISTGMIATFAGVILILLRLALNALRRA